MRYHALSVLRYGVCGTGLRMVQRVCGNELAYGRGCAICGTEPAYGTTVSRPDGEGITEITFQVKSIAIFFPSTVCTRAARELHLIPRWSRLWAYAYVGCYRGIVWYCCSTNTQILWYQGVQKMRKLGDVPGGFAIKHSYQVQSARYLPTRFVLA
eukprot:2677644-Rhodomonas_salina.1